MPIYAAYGSNMHPEQMAERAPHSPMSGTGWLRGWRLTFGGGDIGWEGSLATVTEDRDDPDARVRAADLMRYDGARLFDSGAPCGAEANMAKLLAAEASWEAANTCLQVHGGFGFAAEYDIERKFRETRLYQVAPISTNLILSYLGEHVLGLPRSF